VDLGFAQSAGNVNAEEGHNKDQRRHQAQDADAFCGEKFLRDNAKKELKKMNLNNF
jgi:hypothetical protein